MSRVSLSSIFELVPNNVSLSKFTERPSDRVSARSSVGSAVDALDTAALVVRSRVFDQCCYALILVDAVVMGLEQQSRLEGVDNSTFKYVEHLFLLLYLIELICRGLTRQMRCRVVFDGIVLGACMFSTWVFNPIYGGAEDLPGVAARILRFCRTLYLPGCLLQQSAHQNWTGLVWRILPAAIIVIYSFACMSIELIPLAMQRHEGWLEAQLAKELVQVHFKNLPAAMLTVVQIWTLDNAAAIYKPICAENAVLGMFFVGLVVAVGVVFMIAVGSNILLTLMEQAKHEEDHGDFLGEEMLRQELSKFKHTLEGIDTKRCSVSRDTLANFSPEEAAELEQKLGVDVLLVYDSLNFEAEGMGITQFVSCLDAILLHHTPLEVLRMQCMIESMHCHLIDSRKKQDSMNRAIRRLSQQVTGYLEEDSKLPVRSAVSVLTPSTMESNDTCFGSAKEPAWEESTASEESEKPVVEEDTTVTRDPGTRQEPEVGHSPSESAQETALTPAMDQLTFAIEMKKALDQAYASFLTEACAQSTSMSDTVVPCCGCSLRPVVDACPPLPDEVHKYEVDPTYQLLSWAPPDAPDFQIQAIDVLDEDKEDEWPDSPHGSRWNTLPKPLPRSTAPSLLFSSGNAEENSGLDPPRLDHL